MKKLFFLLMLTLLVGAGSIAKADNYTAFNGSSFHHRAMNIQGTESFTVQLSTIGTARAGYCVFTPGVESGTITHEVTSSGNSSANKIFTGNNGEFLNVWGWTKVPGINDPNTGAYVGIFW